METATIRSRDGIGLAYACSGSGAAACVLIHGWSCSRVLWGRPRLARWWPGRTIALDLAGHGDSRAGRGARAWTIEGFAADVEDVLAACSVEEAVLVGHSMGGPVALETALRIGPRARAVIGVDTFNEATFYRRRPAAEIAARCAPFVGDFGGSMQAMVTRIVAPHTRDALVEHIAAAMSAGDPAVAVAVLAALLRWDIDERWPLLRAPAETINSALAARTNETLELDGLRVHELDGVGHFPMLERPAAFWDTLGSAVARYAGA